MRIVILVLFAASTAAASDPSRKLLRFGVYPLHPASDHDTCSALWFSVNEAFGAMVNHLAEDDQSRSNRIVLTLSSFLLAAGPGYYGHEFGHMVLRVQHGSWPVVSFGGSGGLFIWPTVDIDYGDWDNTGIVSEYDSLPQAVAGGLNQNQIAAKRVWRHWCRTERADLQDWTYFLVNKLATVGYILLDDGFEDWDIPVGPISNPSSTMDGAWVWQNAALEGYTGDCDLYTIFLRHKGIELTKTDLFCQALIADVLTLSIWGSMESILSYGFGRGDWERATTRTPPPIVSYYLTPHGGLYEFEALVGDVLADVYVGTETRMFGLGFSVLDRGERGWNVTPYARWTTVEDESGGSVGLDVVWRTDRFGLHLHGGYRDNDLLENETFGYLNGGVLQLQVEWTY